MPTSRGIRLQLIIQRCEYQRHTNEHSALRLAEISRARIIVNAYLDLVYSGEWVHYYHVLACKLHFLPGEDIHALLALVFLPGRESLLLDSCHVEHIKLGECFFDRVYLPELTAACAEHVLDVFRQRKRRGGDQYELVVLVTGKSLQYGVHGASVLEVAAKPPQSGCPGARAPFSA